MDLTEDGADRPELLADLEDLANRRTQRALGLLRRDAGGKVEVAADGRAEQQVAHDATDQEQLGAWLDLRKLVGNAGAQLLDVGRQPCEKAWRSHLAAFRLRPDDRQHRVWGRTVRLAPCAAKILGALATA